MYLDFSLLKKLHSDSWYLRFCFKNIFKMIKKMLRKFLRNESQDLMERVDYFMKHEAFSVINNIWCHKTKTRKRFKR